METIFSILKSIILGIVEGITEFLPVSSTGHLVIFENFLGFTGTTPSYVEMYTYVIQLGAILAVIVLYWGKIKDTLVNFFRKRSALRSPDSAFGSCWRSHVFLEAFSAYCLMIGRTSTCLRR